MVDVKMQICKLPLKALPITVAEYNLGHLEVQATVGIWAQYGLKHLSSTINEKQQQFTTSYLFYETLFLVHQEF